MPRLPCNRDKPFYQTRAWIDSRQRQQQHQLKVQLAAIQQHIAAQHSTAQPAQQQQQHQQQHR
eukprot:9101733-Pyramimonas_sp.AAC.1